MRALHLSHMLPELVMKRDPLLGHERGVVVHTISHTVNQPRSHRSWLRLTLAESITRLIKTTTSGGDGVKLGSHSETVVTKRTVAAATYPRSKPLMMVAAAEAALLEHLLAHGG